MCVLFEYFRDWIFKSYFLNDSQPLFWHWVTLTVCSAMLQWQWQTDSDVSIDTVPVVPSCSVMSVTEWQWCQHWHCTCRAELFCDVSDRMTVMSALTLYLSCRAVLWCQWQNDSDVSIGTVPVVPSCSVMSVTEWQWCQHWHCTCRAELFCDVSDRMTVMSALALHSVRLCYSYCDTLTMLYVLALCI